MIHIAAWGIFNNSDKQIVKVPYKHRAEGEQLLERMNKAVEGKLPFQKFHMRQIKEPLTDLPCQLSLVLSSDRRIRGVSTNPVTGEDRMWSKVFTDIEVTSLVEGRYILNEMFTAHYHRGTLRIVGYSTYKDFESYVKGRWPIGWEQILMRLP